jgi:hypothetical protein
MFPFFVNAALSSAPIEVNDTTFASQMSNSPLSFLLAFRPEVIYCQEVLPKFLKLSEMINDVQFVILPESGSAQTRERYRIFAWPSLFVFRGLTCTAEYVEERNVPEMYAYLKRILGPAVDILDNARDVSDYVELHRASVILAAEMADHDLNQAFTNVADSLRDIIPFAVASTSDAIQQLGVEEVPCLRLHRNDDRQTAEFPLAFSVTEDILKDWVLRNRVPMYRQKDGVIFRDLAFDQRYTLLAFVDSSRKASLDLMHETLRRVVEDYGGNLTCVYADIFDMGSMVLNLGFSGARDPVYLISDLSSGELRERYIFPERRQPTTDNILKWVADFVNGSAKPRVRSEKPVRDQTGPLFKLVGIEFQETVTAPDLDIVTILLVGSEENRTAALETGREAAEEFERLQLTTIKFFHIDIERNELPGLGVGDWDSPVILLWPAGDKKQPMMFPGNVKSDALVTAIQTYGKSSSLPSPEEFAEL